MLNVPAYDQVVSNEHPLFGKGPLVFWGTAAPDGDAAPWKDAPCGSKYFRTVTAGTHGQEWIKTKNDLRDDDWTGFGFISQRLTRAQFTDGGSTAGTKTLATQIPIGAFVTQTLVTGVTGFIGNTSAVITVGDGSDVDRYNTGTPSVFADANMVAMGVPSGTKEHTAAVTVTVTVTSGTDFTNVSAGALTIKILYYI